MLVVFIFRRVEGFLSSFIAVPSFVSMFVFISPL